jgi:hypothetical protein
MFFRETRWPDEYQNSNWDTGTDKTYLKALLEYRASGYDWRAQEAKLNCLALFVARIGTTISISSMPCRVWQAKRTRRRTPSASPSVA